MDPGHYTLLLRLSLGHRAVAVVLSLNTRTKDRQWQCEFGAEEVHYHTIITTIYIFRMTFDVDQKGILYKI